MRRSLLTSLLLVSVLLTPARAQEPNDAGNAPPQEGTVLLADTFDDPESGALPRVSPDPTRSRLGYVDGEYVLRTFSAGNARVSIPGAYSDYSVALDVWIVGDSSENLIEIGLRRQGTGTKDYRLALQNGRRIILRRWDDPNGPILGQMDLPSNLQPSDGRHHLELSAFGRNIVAKVNGAVVIAAQDDTYQSGTAWIGVLSNSGAVEARFDNLVVTRREASEPAPPLDIVLATAAPIAPPAQPAAQAPGAVLLSDNFDDSAKGRLPTGPDKSYVDGEYRLVKTDPAARIPGVALPGRFRDTTIAIDVRLVGDSSSTFVSLACRGQEGSGSGYSASLQPEARSLGIFRWDGDTPTALVDQRPSAAIKRRGATNHVELACVGRLIWVTVNGTFIAVAEDAAYGEGELRFGAGVSNATSEARFDNLIVTQRDPSEAPQTPLPAPRPGDTILFDDFSDPDTGWLPTSTRNAWEQVRYVDGEYEIRKMDWLSPFIADVQIPGTYTDATAKVEGRLLSDGDSLVLFCRANRSGRYQLYVFPWSREYLLSRVDTQGESESITRLAKGQSRAVQAGAVNRIELSCVGNTIEAKANDTRLASAEDGTYRAGSFWVGASSPRRSTATARFDNLVLIQR